LPDGSRPVFLIGYRGSGKSSVGRALAAKLQWDLCDTDSLVEEATGQSIAEYFSVEGEAAFRVREAEALASVVRQAGSGRKLVAATGGGIILNPANVDSMRRTGTVVWLVASVETLQRRIGGDPASGAMRPALQGSSSVDEVEKVLREREPLYRAAAHFEILAEHRSPEEIASGVLEQLKLKRGDL